MKVSNTRDLNGTNKHEQGVALVISVILLAAIFGLVIGISDVSLNILKSNKDIGLSEVALFAAESAAEMTIYEVEQDPRKALINILPSFNQPLCSSGLDICSATWSREVQVATTTPGLCGVSKPKPVCTTLGGTVNIGNSLFVTLESGESFQMELDIETASYPNHVRVVLGGHPSRVIITNIADNTIEFSTSDTNVPTSGTIDSADGLKFRIINEAGVGSLPHTYEIRPQGGLSGVLPVGLNIRGKAEYLNVEREIQLTRPSWLIY